MNSAPPSGIWLRAALVLSFFLSAGSAQVSAAPITPDELPTITISIEDGPNAPKWSWTPSANDLRVLPGAGRGRQLAAQKQFNILSNRAQVVVQGLEFDPDPFVLNNIIVTNTTAIPQTFSAFVGLPTSFAAPNLLSGNVLLGVIDGGLDGATVTNVTGQPIYQAQIDLATVATLQNDPFTLIAPIAGSSSATASFAPTLSAIPVNTNIGIQLRFTLTPGDTVSILSRFDVVAVPEPGSAALIGLGLVLITRRSRRR
jgi:hypothetical protein